jgi:hypothetical protein
LGLCSQSNRTNMDMTSREEETRCTSRDDDVEMSVAAHEVEATTNLSAPRTATSIAPSTVTGCTRYMVQYHGIGTAGSFLNYGAAHN